MNISARNVFEGTISSLTHGDVNAEVELSTPGGDTIVATVTEASVKSLGLEVGNPAVAFAKAPWVMLVTGEPTIRFSARNQLQGTVKKVTKGAVNTEVALELPGGTVVHAVVTNESADDMKLEAGVPACALIKASHIILGVPKSKSEAYGVD